MVRDDNAEERIKQFLWTDSTELKTAKLWEFPLHRCVWSCIIIIIIMNHINFLFSAF